MSNSTTTRDDLLRAEIGNCLANFGVQGEHHTRLLNAMVLTVRPVFNQTQRADMEYVIGEDDPRDSDAHGTVCNPACHVMGINMTKGEQRQRMNERLSPTDTKEKTS